MAGRVACVTLCVATLCAVTACSSSSTSTKPPSRTEIAQLLNHHGHAVTAGDRKAFLADIASGPFRNRQQVVFDNLAKVPLRYWAYSIGPAVDAADAQAAVRKKYDSSALIVQVALRYALRGIDKLPTEHDLWWTFVRRDGRVQVTGDTDLASAGGASWRGPWDFGRLDVVGSGAALVLGHDDNFGLLTTVAAAVDAAVPVVTSVWGTKWARRVAAFVPSSAAELDAALGPTSSVTAPVAAIATSDGTDNLSGTVLGQRLVVEPQAFQRLTATGRQIVVQHEVTHIADATATSDATPRWLAEGFAEYVGNLQSGQTVKFAAAELARAISRGAVPIDLPADAAFDTSSTAAQAYQSSWLACRLIARDVGVSGLLRFYRTVGASHGPSDEAVGDALRSVLHLSTQQFVARWQAYLRAQLL